MTRARIWFAVTTLVAAAMVASCGDSITQPAGPATATATLSSGATDGAILLRVTGPGFENAPVVVSHGQVLYSRQVSETEMTVAVFGPIANGVLFKVGVPDGGKVSSYTVTVMQVADRDNALRADLAGYTVAFTVAPSDAGQ